MLLQLLFLISLPFLLYGESLSYYEGYVFYKDRLQNSDYISDYNQFLKGMKAAHDGLELSYDLIDSKKRELIAQANDEKLIEANHFMSELIANPTVIQLVPGKLAYEIIKAGSGAEVEFNDSPKLLYKAETIVKGRRDLVSETHDPKRIMLKSTIDGFAQGVTGMKEGEKRILYIHPDLAYGKGSHLIAPNSQMIFEVEIIEK